MMLTQELAKEILSYNKETGVVLWKIPAGGRRKSGVAGSVHKHPNGRWVVTIGINKKAYYIHRVIWLMETGDWPDEIDHINGDATDNKWSNLRNVSHTGNMRSRARPKNNTSGMTGVTWYKAQKIWIASISHSGLREIQLYRGKDFF